MGHLVFHFFFRNSKQRFWESPTTFLLRFKKQENVRFSTIYDFTPFLEVSRGQTSPTLSEKESRFFEWFLGFAKRDGSFGIYNGRLVLTINKAEIEILYKIRAVLGCGIVSTFHQAGRVYGRYRVSIQQTILWLIHFFNGNLHLEKTYVRFTLCVEHSNANLKPGCPAIIMKPRRFPEEISLETAWIAGFYDAEGGFSASISTSEQRSVFNSEESLKFGLRLNGYVDQKNKDEILKRIASLFEIPNVTTRSKERKTYRVNGNTKRALRTILDYFEKHTFCSKKHVVYAIWRRIVFSYLKNFDRENFPPLKDQVERLQKQNNFFKD